MRTGKYKVITKREVAQMNRSGLEWYDSDSDPRSPVMVGVHSTQRWSDNRGRMR